MKNFKSTLIIIALCASSSIFAIRISQPKTTAQGAAKGKTRGERVPAKPAIMQPIIQPTEQTYIALLSQIKSGTIGVAVLDNNNMLTSEFIELIKGNNNLSIEEKTALLQAGANLSIKWTGDPVKDNKILTALNSQIDTILGRFVIIPEAPGTTTTPEFYDDQTNLLKQNVLDAEIEAVQAGQSENELISSFTRKYQDLMIPIWNEKQITDRPSKVRALRQQIANAVKEIKATKPIKVLIYTLLNTPDTRDNLNVAYNDQYDAVERQRRFKVSNIVQTTKKEFDNDQAKNALINELKRKFGASLGKNNISTEAAVNKLWETGDL